MANVLRVVTPITTSKVSSSRSLYDGKIEEIAKAAEAPQIATANPDRTPNLRFYFSILAINTPNKIVQATVANIPIIDAYPSSITFANIIRSPRRATPTRNTVRDINSTPLLQRSSSEKKFNDIPISNARSIVGPP